ncbi:MAG: dicarboxylate/amino acid:cation symporter [Burkholderiaceae bacterium]
MILLKKLVTSPITIIGSIILGIVCGLKAPDYAHNLKFIGDVYIDLLKMVILPFLFSAVIVSINRLSHDPSASKYMGKIAFFLFVGMGVAGLVGLIYMKAAHPGSNLDHTTIQSFGKLVQSDMSGVETSISLLTPYVGTKQDGVVGKFISRMIPDNIFNALSMGDTLKTLIFALMFAFGLTKLGTEKTRSIVEGCEVVFKTCQKLTTWLLYLLPIASFSLAAEQIASTGIEPLKIMVQFILAFCAATIILLVMCLFIIWRRSDKKLMDVVRSQEGPFFIAVATRNSAACMPAMMTSMIDKLGFNKSITELLVPLGTALFRVGPVLYYVMATVFIAQLYGRDLSLGDCGLVLLASMIAGFSSTGMNGVITISQTTIVCSLLGLPFEAAFVLFVAVEPICDTFRTVLLVFSIDTLVAIIAPIGNDVETRLKPEALTV